MQQKLITRRSKRYKKIKENCKREHKERAAVLIKKKHKNAKKKKVKNETARPKNKRQEKRKKNTHIPNQNTRRTAGHMQCLLR